MARVRYTTGQGIEIASDPEDIRVYVGDAGTEDDVPEDAAALLEERGYAERVAAGPSAATGAKRK
jgi:hypothetical protein